MADFDFSPHRVEPGCPEYNIVESESETMVVKTRLKSTKPRRSWILYFRVQSNDERNALLAHFNGQGGGTIPFKWTSIPAHIASDTSINVRYKQYSEVPTLFNIWEITITFIEYLGAFNFIITSSGVDTSSYSTDYQKSSGVLNGSGLVSSGVSFLKGFMITTDTVNDVTLTLFDSVAGSGAKLIPTIYLAGPDKEYILNFDPLIRANNGIYALVDCIGTCDFIIFYNN